MSAENPWLGIPAADYEGHMGPSGVDQLEPLRSLFAEVYRERRPRRLAVLGCGPGGGLEVVDPVVTERLVAVDLNAQYLALARRRHIQLEAVAEWVCAPVEACALEGGFALIHAALLLEYVDPVAVLPRIADWLAPQGTFSVVLQLPGGDAAISATGFASLQSLAPLMRLVPPERLCADAEAVGLRLRSSREVPVARGKRFWVGRFEPGR